MMNKKADFGGVLYPKNPQYLYETILSLLISVKNIYDNNANLNGKILISPHSNYMYSGHAMAAGYKAFASNKMLKRFIVIGSNYKFSGDGLFFCDYDNYENSIGITPLDKDLQNILISKLGNCAKINNGAFDMEYAIEIQLPFIRAVFDVQSILPIICGSNCDVGKISDILSQILSQSDDIGIIVSTDLSHQFDYKNAKINDQKTIETIVNLKSDLPDGSITCLDGIKIVIDISKQNGYDILPLMYMNSGDISSEKDLVAGYGALIAGKFID